MKIFYSLLLAVVVACGAGPQSWRTRIDLSGHWQFALDTAQVGISENWQLRDLPDSILLPGTTDLRQKGFLNTDSSTLHLHRRYRYTGAAWYRRRISIPESMRHSHLQLVLERSRSTQVWVDDKAVGQSQLLQSPQEFDLTPYLSPGEHVLTVLVNNDPALTPYGNVHIYSDDTQTNWNGLLGQLYIEASAPTRIAAVQAFPQLADSSVRVELELEAATAPETVEVELRLELLHQGKATPLKTLKQTLKYASKLELNYHFEQAPALWDDYEQPLYQLTAIVHSPQGTDAHTTRFGMRQFAARGTQFSINGRPCFLRGKHEAAVFPLTGFAPMDAQEWKRVFSIAKSYGINHYRFHTYCPPQAAFEAADELGIFLQAELPFWGGLESDTTAQLLHAEGRAMLRAYANHPSFVLFSAGNEIWSGHQRVAQLMRSLKQYDSRPLYAMGSNNNIGYRQPDDYCDYFVGARVPERGDTTLGHARLTHAFADAHQGGILNTRTPGTQHHFGFAVAHMPLPLVSHEIGQYQIYPRYREIEKYTGVLQARNLEIFRNRLKNKGMGHMDSLFQQASGAWAALCYKAEMEAALGTRGMAGFQLLDLQDFPGQGTALVGILDAFMDDKQVVSPRVWRQSCNDVVLLAQFPRYCWTTADTFATELLVANYSKQPLAALLHWQISTSAGQVLQQGSFGLNKPAPGTLLSAGRIALPLASVAAPQRLLLKLHLPDSDYSNEYPLWVYPRPQAVSVPAGITVARQLSPSLLQALEKGASVLLFPQAADVRHNSLPGHFPPEFWNYGMFKGISQWAKKPVSPGTLGLLTDPAHPIFAAFPTDLHTNWQWFSVLKASQSLILDSLPAAHLPIVQIIDNLERNHKLGLIFEAKVGQGKLLVCMAPLPDMPQAEAQQLYRALLGYVQGGAFEPKDVWNTALIQKLFY